MNRNVNLAYQYKIPTFSEGEKLWASFRLKNKRRECFEVCEVLEVDIEKARYRVRLDKFKKLIRKWVSIYDAYPYVGNDIPPTMEEVEYRMRRAKKGLAKREVKVNELKIYRDRNKQKRCWNLKF